MLFFVFLLHMDIQAEKYHLIQQIVNLQDSSIISRLKELLNSQSTTTDWYDELTISQKTAIEKSLKQADNGETIPHSVVKKQIREKIQQLKKNAS